MLQDQQFRHPLFRRSPTDTARDVSPFRVRLDDATVETLIKLPPSAGPRRPLRVVF